MSRSPFAPLFEHLVDDAAVFPPGLSPIDAAVREHLERRTGPYAGLLGPLLVPATAAAEVAPLAAADARTADRPLEVGLIVRPGTPVDPLLEAVDLLRDEPRVLVTSAQLGWSPDWRRALDTALPLVVEVGIGPEQEAGLDDVAAAVDDDHEVAAKFRTGATPTWVWPDEATLAGFLDAAVLRAVPFKLTGGLHHAVRGAYPEPAAGHAGEAGDDAEPMHGVLNVLLAVHEALDGAEAPELAHTLARHDTEHLVEAVSALDTQEARRVRERLTAFGCCGVLDPITELEALGLLP